MRLPLTRQRTSEDQQLTVTAAAIILDHYEQLLTENTLLRQRVRYLENRLRLATPVIREVVAIPAQFQHADLMQGARATRPAAR